MDFESCSHSVIGACNSLDSAVVKLHKHITEAFEDNKEWWDDEEDEDAINEPYQEWIDENYLDDEHLAWSYTDDDGIEYLFKIVAAEIEYSSPLQDVYVVLYTCIDGCDNNTELIGVYPSQEEANMAMETCQTEYVCNDKDGFMENVFSVEKVAIENLVKK